MKLQAFLVASFLVTLAAVPGCGSNSNGGSSGSSPSVFCSASVAGSSVCYGYTNLTSSQQSAVSSSCTSSLSGEVVSACPTEGLAGCCKYTAAGITTEECFYQSGDDAGLGSFGDPTAAGKQACSAESGSWSSGI